MLATSTPPIVLAQRLIAGRHADPETADWLASGFSAWLNAGGALPLLRCLGMPATVLRVKTAMRDQWLLEAAQFIGAAKPWARAKALSEEAERFERRAWLAWKHLDLPPDHASELQKRLFLALKVGIELPASTKQWANILEA